MLKQPAQAVIDDVGGNSGVILDINFDDNLKHCVKITIDGAVRIVKYSDLFSFMFTLATKEQQAKMIPVKEELGTQYMKKIFVKVTKDLKVGDKMIVNVPINVPKVIEDSILKEKELSTPTPY